MGSESAEVDISQLGDFTPKRVKDQYRNAVQTIVEANPQLNLNPQTAFDHIRSSERKSGAYLFGVDLSEEATQLQAQVFNRKLLRLRTGLNIATQDEKRQLDTINEGFSQAAGRLSSMRGISIEEADDTLMKVLQYRGLKDVDDAIERLTKGPKIIGKEDADLFDFDFSNKNIGNLLETSFGLDTILKSRLLEISKGGGFAVKCKDIAYGNDCVHKYNAKWEKGYLILPDRNTYEQVEMHLEGASNVEDLEHSYKIRATTESIGGFATFKVYDFIVEQPSHFDYLQDLSLSDADKMKAYFLGIFAHETVHAIQANVIDRAIFDEYSSLAKEEQSTNLNHSYVSKYVDNHHKVFKSNENETIGEDMAEAIRIFVTNSDYLKSHFPKRYNFIQAKLPFIRENAILNFMSRSPSESHEAVQKEN